MATHPQAIDGVDADGGEHRTAATGAWAPPVPGALGAAGRAAAGWLVRQLRDERPRWFLWLPVALGLGIALYFSLPAEPPLMSGAAALALPLAALAWRRRAAAAGATAAFEAPLLVGLAALALGFAAAQLRTAGVDAPVLERRGAYQVEGRLLLVEERTRGRRLLIGDPKLADVPDGATPARVRVTVRGDEPALRPGDTVRLRAVLLPPSPPTRPGGFDFARRAYFERLGAVGYGLGAPELVAAGGGGLDTGLARLRQEIAGRVGAIVPGPAGAVAGALLTGLRAGIPDRVWSDMQAAGLAHLLAISGLHLGLVAGTLFLAARTAITLAPALALRLPTKKVAAAIALAGAAGYLLLAGATVPTQRAFVMTALVLLAVLVDRSALSMRTVALAAGAVLLLRPEALLGPSFQMSFAAVVALIAVYESGALGLSRVGRERSLPRPLVYLAGVALTTLVASAATAPFTVYSFQRLATYGLVGNLVAVPLTAFWVMPAGLLGLLLMPLGLEAPWFALMGLGVELVLAVAATVAAWPGATVLLDEPPTAAIAAATLGGLWLCLWRRPWRWCGAAGLAAGLAVAALARPPDLLIAGGGDLIAARLGDGRLAVAPWRRDAFVTDGWLRADGQDEPAPWPEPGFATAGDRLRCDGLGCVYRRGGRSVALARRAEALAEDCARADLVVTALRVGACRGDGADAPPLLGGRELWAAGAVALWLREGGVRRTTVAGERGRRPWARPGR